jgi:Fe-S-cluster containining protein
MEIDRKLKALGRIYAVYDEFVRTQETACRMHCARCCTTRVTLTTLEAYHIIQTLPAGEAQKLFARIRAASGLRRFRPRVTTNELAELCAADAEQPLEEEFTDEKCPLLAGELCAIYAVRPFNCRCFISRVNCAEGGYADVDECSLAVNTLFLQTIEHLDADGCSGNLLDLLADEGKRQSCVGGTLPCAGNGLIANRPLKVLMIPPEHRAKIEPIMRKLREIRL